ncbi:unnamed protein product [Amoebophrya sp. A25]|nr:unnamed protein product [Amoebophrya sp. A25]|eukprot:GSA25T00001466001.1
MQSFYAPPPSRGSEFASWLNSGAGRFLLFLTTIGSFILACVGLSFYASPGEKSGGENVSPRSQDEQFLILLATVLNISAFYSLPVFAERCGVGVFDANWKPYVHIYRIAFFFSIPALICISSGFGSDIQNASRIPGSNFQQLLTASKGDLNLVIGDYFIVSDMFVGLNLTKAVIKTLTVPNARGSTREQERRGEVFQMPTLYSETEYFDTKDALAGPPPPMPRDVLEHYAFAPIFETWRTCVTRYAVSSICMRENKLIGFVMKNSDNLCRRAGALGCSIEPKPKLNPSYRCTDPVNAVRGLETRLPITGLCGRVVLPPPQILLDEIVKRHIDDGWMLGESMACHCSKDGEGSKIACPDPSDTCKKIAPLFFVNADYDDRIAKTGDLESGWLLYQIAGGVFAFLTLFCVILTMLADCYVDRYLRAAAKYAT